MAKQRTPRRLLILVRYLEGVLVDPKASAAMKQVASGRLVEVLLSAERTKERAAIAIERAQARAREQEQSRVSPEAPDELLQPTGPSGAVPDVSQTVKEYLAQFTKTA